MTNTDETSPFDNVDKIVEAFSDFDLENLLKSVERDYYVISVAFQKARDEAHSRGDIYLAAGLHLLWAVCNYHAQPENEAEPFGPMMVVDNKRTPIPDDLTQDQLSILSAITNHITDHFLRGRIADVVWLQGKPRNYKFALMAIESYTEGPIDPSSWFRKGEDNWRRALSLARDLGNSASSLLTKIESTLMASLVATQVSDRYFGARIASALRDYGLARSEATTIAGKLADLASQFHHIGNYYASADHFAAAAKWCRIANDERQQMAMIALQSKAIVRAAEARIEDGEGGYLVAAVDVEKALQVLRQIPITYRVELGVDALLVELPIRLREYGEQSLGEMKTVELPAMDVSEFVRFSQGAVRGKSASEAFLILSNLHNQDASKLREDAKKTLEEYPLQALFGRVTLSADGRPIARSRGSDSYDPSQDEAQVCNQMLQSYGLHVAGTVHTTILPALQVIRSEHRLRESDFVTISRQSPFVPIGREKLFGKALAFGFNGDYATAIHMLTPQIENAVRYHLRAAGVQTSGVNLDGLEGEKSLNALLDLPQIEVLFGEDIAFELRALFCEQVGGNLRNEVAHGLLDDVASTSDYCVYAWWFALKLAYMSFWNNLVARSTREPPSDDGSDAAEEDGSPS